MTATTSNELASARSGDDLVPGSPARVLALADQLDDMAAGLAASQRLLGVAGGTGWRGAAATSFAALVRSLPAPYASGGPVIAAAAAGVRSHAQTLAAAQQQADEALHLARRAAAMTSTPGAPGGVVGPSAAEAMHRRAEAEVAQARGRVRTSGSQVAGDLRRAAAAAPKQPNPLVRVLHDVLRAQRGLQVGAIEATVGTVTGAASVVAHFSSVRLLLDPRGWLSDVRGLGTTAGRAAAHPLRTATTVIDPTTMRQDPSRWVGRLAPDVALGLATGGVGAVANRGVSLPVKAAAALRRGSAGADVRAAVEAARATSRSRLRGRDLREWSHVNDFGHPTELTPGQRMATAALARDAQWAEHEVRSRVSGAARDVGAELAGVEFAVKGQDSLFRKVSGNVSKPVTAQTRIDGRAPIERALPDVHDTVRYTLVAEPDAYVASVLATVQALRARGLILVNPKATWAKTGYRGVNMTMADPTTGRLLEVQVHTRASYEAGKATRKPYERVRQVGCPPAETTRLNAAIARVYAAVPVPPGALRLQQLLDALPRQADATNRPPQLLSTDPRPFLLRTTGGALATAGADPEPSLSSSDDRRAGRAGQHGHQREHGGGAP